MERGERPIADAPDKSMFDRIEMNVVNMSIEIFRIADGVFPESPLP
jgi:hypothetical protein